MDVALGLKAHSGWAALVVVGKVGGGFDLGDRRRVDLVEEPWEKQPYHAAEELDAGAARELVERAVEGAHRGAVRELGAAVEREARRGNRAIACAVLVGASMPSWSVEDILAVHLRMHMAEGVLFRGALLHGARTCGLHDVAVAERSLGAAAEQALAITSAGVAKVVAALGKGAGPPWGKDQKDAALAAIVALVGAGARP